MLRRWSLTMLALTAFTAGCGPDANAPRASDADIEARMQKYAVTPMQMNLEQFSERERLLLKELLVAAEFADEIFWHQTSHLALPLRARIRRSYGKNDPIRRFYVMQAGPWDRLDDDAPFIEGVPPKSPGAGFYPDGMTDDEFQAWIEEHPDDREAFLSPYTVIKRQGDHLVAVPYHKEYKDLVDPLAASLRKAADLSDNESFARYLRAKADAVLSDQYFDADTAWIKMSGNKFDVSIGPFEVYEDQLLGIKAAYEASVEIVDQKESAKLEVYKGHLGELEANLPYPDRYKPSGFGLTASFTIVRDIYRGGDLRVGYQPVAANLPNDPRVQSEVGAKRTFWKNFFEARVDKVVLPISGRLIAEDQVKDVTPQGFFDLVLLHELAHGLGPRYAQTRRGRVSVNEALTTQYSWLEESKATVAGLESLAYLVRAGVTDAQMLPQYYVSYLGSIFRSVRFGTSEAHGLAALVELNYFLQQGGITYDPESERWAVDFDLLPGEITELARTLLTIEATGDIIGAESLRDEYGQRTPELEAALARVADVPVDPTPVYENEW